MSFTKETILKEFNNIPSLVFNNIPSLEFNNIPSSTSAKKKRY